MSSAVTVVWSLALVMTMMIVFYQRNVDVAGATQTRSKQALDEVYLALLPFGYNTRTVYSAKDTSRLSAAQVEGMIEKLLGQVVCSFTAIAVQHQLAVTYFVEAWRSGVSLKDNILFDGEARTMLSLAYWLKGGSDARMRPLWLNYTYEMYLLSVVQDSRVFPRVHKAVVDELIGFTVKECHQISQYGDDATNSEIRDDLHTLQTDPTSPLIRRKCIVRNKHQISEYLEGNAQASRAVAMHDKGFSPGSIHLNHIMQSDRILVNLLRDFGQQERWTNTADAIRASYRRVREQTRPDLWAKHLGGVLRESVHLLKALMLRFVCKHLVHLNHELRYTAGSLRSTGIIWMPTEELRILSELNRTAAFWINGFVEFMDFGDDPDFVYVLDLLENRTRHLYSADKRTEAFTTVNGMMNAVAESLGIAVSCPEVLNVDDEAKFLNMVTEILARLNLDDVAREKLTVTRPRQLLEHSVQAMSVFVQYVQQKLVGVDMKVVKCFIGFARELKTFKIKPRVYKSRL